MRQETAASMTDTEVLARAAVTFAMAALAFILVFG